MEADQMQAVRQRRINEFADFGIKAEPGGTWASLRFSGGNAEVLLRKLRTLRRIQQRKREIRKPTVAIGPTT